MTEALFDVDTPAEAEPVPEPRKWTERDMLDLLHLRYTRNQHGNGPRYVMAEHVRNYCGFAGYRTITPLRTADALAVDLWPSSGHVVHGFEVKVSRSDWLTELKDPEKAEAFKPYCDYWWLVVPDAAIVRDDLPPGWGLMTAVGTNGLRIRIRAPRLDRQPMPFEMTASWLRATAKTAQLPVRGTEQHTTQEDK
jgi:hypothetical protein